MTTVRRTLEHIAVFAVISGTVSLSHAQDAAQPTVDLQSGNDQAAVPAATPSNPPDVPELSKLDEAFKQSSLGKAADEYRLRIELRRLQNLVGNDSAILAARAAAESARTDLEKRQRLRDYYNIYYGRMRSLTSSPETQAALEKFKAEHLVLLNQPTVRHETDGALPAPVRQRKQKSKKHSVNPEP